MKYYLFTYPNCSRCEELKAYLSQIKLETEVHNLVTKESKLKIRDFLKVLKRDAKGGIIIPTLIVQEQEGVAAVCNSREEFADWLQSKV
jgi:glutaredoxin